MNKLKSSINFLTTRKETLAVYNFAIALYIGWVDKLRPHGGEARLFNAIATLGALAAGTVYTELSQRQSSAEVSPIDTIDQDPDLSSDQQAL